MKRLVLAVVAGFIAASLMMSVPADARRLGGGGSLGAQRSMAPKPPATAQTTPSSPSASNQPVMPAQPGATLPAKPGAAAAAAPSGMSRWLGPIAGIAAGLGLAALLAHFGLPEGLGTFLVIALFVIAAIFLVRMLLARRTTAAASGGPPMAYSSERTEPTLAKRMTPDVIWSGPAKPDPAVPLPPPQPAAGSRAALPAGFDAAGFARNAKAQFVRMQAAYDAGDRKQLADLMTPEMFAEISQELTSRGVHQPTEIVSMEAEVLEAATEGKQHWASVRYTGLVREDGDANPKPLDEVWNLTKPIDGSSGWLLAGIQQYA